jgi:hypothetical protein
VARLGSPGQVEECVACQGVLEMMLDGIEESDEEFVNELVAPAIERMVGLGVRGVRHVLAKVEEIVEDGCHALAWLLELPRE